MPIIKAHLQGLDKVMQQQQQQQPGSEPEPRSGRGRGSGGSSGSGPVLLADISMGTANGLAAVSLVQQCVLRLPPLRPLCLVLKAMLKEAGRP